MSEKPEYNDKIVEAYLLAPAVFMNHATHPIFLLSEWVNNIEDVLQWLGMYEFVPQSSFVSWIGHLMCNDQASENLGDICENLAFAFFGINPDQMNELVQLQLFLGASAFNLNI